MRFVYIFTHLIFLGFHLDINFAENVEGVISKDESQERGKRSEPKSYYQSASRRFSFPPGTFLIFEPELTLPTWRDHPIFQRSHGKVDHDREYLACDGSWSSPREGLLEGDGDVSAVKNSDIQISSPFYVYFDKLGWTHEDSIYNSHHLVAPYFQNYLVNPVLEVFGVPSSQPGLSKTNSKKDGPTIKENSKSNRKRMPLSDSHRLAIFQKLEKLLEEIGVLNGKACLLRAICEIHEFPFESGRFGLLGEVVALILGSIPKDSGESYGDSCLTIYSKAESSGKQKDCFKYARHCQHSIFQWYWKFSNNALIEK